MVVIDLHFVIARNHEAEVVYTFDQRAKNRDARIKEFADTLGNPWRMSEYIEATDNSRLLPHASSDIVCDFEFHREIRRVKRHAWVAIRTLPGGREQVIEGWADSPQPGVPLPRGTY